METVAVSKNYFADDDGFTDDDVASAKKGLKCHSHKGGAIEQHLVRISQLLMNLLRTTSQIRTASQVRTASQTRLDRTPSVGVLAFVVLLAVSLVQQPGNAASRVSFNEDWAFAKGAFPEAELPDFNDDEWRTVELPHDWAIEGPFDPKYDARCGGLPYHGTGWYRKSFPSPKLRDGDRVAIAFDGVMSNATVWVNGHQVGGRPNGYIGFEIDVTPHLRTDGTKNLIAVQLQPEPDSSRWYPGAGIYRNVWLHIRPAVHVPQWGVTVTTPEVAEDYATVATVTEIRNSTSERAEVSVRQTILAPDRRVVATGEERLEIAGSSQSAVEVELKVAKPQLWGLESPHLYTLVTEILHGTEVVTEAVETRFGIRTIAFDAEAGFTLNGKPVRLNGVCLHHDLGPLGTAVNRRAIQRQLEIMQSMGVNAIRTSHNPPAPEQLDLCDEQGILVIVEAFDCWKIAKAPNDYSKHFDQWHERDLVDMVRRDRNHPSVMMWSLGNEVAEQSQAEGWKVAKQLHHLCRRADPTRPTTAGLNNYPAPFGNSFAEQFDIAGLNYKPMFYESLHQEYPNLILYGSETSSCTSSRGVYHLPIEKYKKHSSLQVTSYDFIAPNWAYPPDVEFAALDANPNVLGEFVWTGFDYLGEPTPYRGFDQKRNKRHNEDWPARSSYFGCVDLCGFPKDRYYLYQCRWIDRPLVHLLPHWNWEDAEKKTIPVHCYTNCEEAELFLNGESLGRRQLGVDKTLLPVGGKHLEKGMFESKYRICWDVPYSPGELRVVAYREGKPIAEDRVLTAGVPATIQLQADRSSLSGERDDLVFVTARVLDSAGVPCPWADNLIQFEVTTGGRLVAVGNGDPTSTESFQAPARQAFSGQCLAIVGATSEMPRNFTLTASSVGLQSASLVIGTGNSDEFAKKTARETTATFQVWKTEK